MRDVDSCGVAIESAMAPPRSPDDYARTAIGDPDLIAPEGGWGLF